MVDSHRFVGETLAGSVTLLRADLNVSIDASGDISDTYRLAETAPTIAALRDAGARVVVCSHLGRPQGTPDTRWSLRPVAPALERLLATPVQYYPGAIDPGVPEAIAALPPGGVLLLENLRFWPGEEANDPDFAFALARLADAFVNDAFGTMHRAHASIVGVPRHLPSRPGLLVQREVDRITEVLEQPDQPLALVLGGAKVHDKLPLLERLLPHTSVVCIGGAMANAIGQYRAGLASLGAREGDDVVGRASDLLAEAERARGTRVLLPVDAVASRELAGQRAIATAAIESVPAGWETLDAGPRTLELFTDALADASTVIWNGPLGKFEIAEFAAGSTGLAQALAASEARVLAGGGDTAAAARLAGVADRFWHLSTGGGATLAMLGGEAMPGLEALGFDTPAASALEIGMPVAAHARSTPARV